MASALSVRKSQKTTPHLIVGGILAVPVFVLLRFWVPYGVLHVNDVRINFFLHVLLIFWPLLLAFWVVSDIPEYYASDEIALASATFASKIRYHWYAILPLFASLFIAFIIGGYEIARWCVEGVPHWTTSGLSAAATLLLTTLLLMFYGTMLRLRPTVYLSEAGLRTGIQDFMEWESIDHLVQHDNRYWVYHRAQPRLPVTGFTLPSSDAQKILSEALKEQQISVKQSHTTLLPLLQAAVCFVTLLLVLVGCTLYGYLGLDLRWVVVFCTACAVGVCLTVDKMRGDNHVTKQKPVPEV